jgi:HlyD family secretion protein
MRGFITLVVVLALAVAGAGGWYWYTSVSHAVGYRTVAVERGNLLATISATGTIEPEEVVDIGAQVAGMIKAFGRDPRDSNKPVDYGTPVEKDTVLALIDDSLYAADVEQAKAQLGQAQANVQKAQADLQQMQAKLYQTDRDWTRAKQLGRTKGVIADVDYDMAQNAYETAKAAIDQGQAALELAKKGVDQAQANLNRAKINLGYCTIKSPVKGVIVDRRVNAGQTVVSSLNAPSLFLIAKDLKRMQVWASVNEADIGNIIPGQPVTFTVDAYPNETFRGDVEQVRLNASMTQNVVTYTVVVNTDNSSGKLLPYLTANLQFEVSQKSNVLLVPNAALRWKPQMSQVAPDARPAFAKSLQRRGPAAYAAPEEKPAPKADKEKEHGDRGALWVQDGDFVRPAKVRIGLTDGVNTEIISGDLKDGSQVVVGEARQNGADNTTNPFMPQMFGGSKKGQ